MKNYTITMSGNVYRVTVEEGMFIGAAPVTRATAPAPKAVPAVAPKAAPVGAAGSMMVPTPTPDKILGVKTAVGQAVEKGDIVVVPEATKVENEIAVPSDGTTASVNVSAGNSVGAGATLVILSQDNAL